MSALGLPKAAYTVLRVSEQDYHPDLLAQYNVFHLFDDPKDKKLLGSLALSPRGITSAQDAAAAAGRALNASPDAQPCASLCLCNSCYSALQADHKKPPN